MPHAQTRERGRRTLRRAVLHECTKTEIFPGLFVLACVVLSLLGLNDFESPRIHRDFDGGAPPLLI